MLEGNAVETKGQRNDIGTNMRKSRTLDAEAQPEDEDGIEKDSGERRSQCDPHGTESITLAAQREGAVHRRRQQYEAGREDIDIAERKVEGLAPGAEEREDLPREQNDEQRVGG